MEQTEHDRQSYMLACRESKQVRPIFERGIDVHSMTPFLRTVQIVRLFSQKRVQLCT